VLRATSFIRPGDGHSASIVDSITLDHGARHRRRMVMTADGGLSFLLDLVEAAVLQDRDALRLEDGRLIAVKAAPERLIEIRAGNPLRLMQVVWHLGNRHVPTELAVDAIYIAEDHVLLDMVRGLGASAGIVVRPFHPERGAYDDQGGHEDASHGHHGHDRHSSPHAHYHGSHDQHGHEHDGDPHGSDG
jgi:urease accessory protein